jgi:hypothetical protein
MAFPESPVKFIYGDSASAFVYFVQRLPQRCYILFEVSGGRVRFTP